MTGMAAIFDMDGVLVDTEPIYMEIDRRLFSRLGLKVSDEQVSKFVGLGIHGVWQWIKDHFDLPQTLEELVAMAEEEQVREMAAAATLVPMPGVMALIQALRARQVRLGVATGSPRKVAEVILGRAGFLHQFEVIISGSDVSRGKPDPEIFLETSGKLGVSPAACVVIEDSPHGVAAAIAAGMTVVGFQNHNSGRQDLSDADFVIGGFSEDDNQRILGLFHDRY